MFILAGQSSVAHSFLAELRDVSLQNDRPRFRRNLERLGQILAYEISKTLPYTPYTLTTPHGPAAGMLPGREVVLATILRAGLPFYQGFLHIFDGAESAFVGAYRSVPAPDGTFDVVTEYIASPDLTGKTLILLDPMLATGHSLQQAYRALCQHGTPAATHLAAVIASPEGVAYVQSTMPECSLWLGALDAHLDEHFYIVPGLGDAGDLAFGPKV